LLSVLLPTPLAAVTLRYLGWLKHSGALKAGTRGGAVQPCVPEVPVDAGKSALNRDERLLPTCVVQQQSDLGAVQVQAYLSLQRLWLSACEVPHREQV